MGAYYFYVSLFQLHFLWSITLLIKVCLVGQYVYNKFKDFVHFLGAHLQGQKMFSVSLSLFDS